MTNITVKSQSQRIIVNPATSSVSVINGGPQGTQGAQGYGVRIEGSDTYANIIALPSPDIGDMWIQTNTAGGGNDGDGLIWNGTTWTNVGPIQGPQGEQGIPGEDSTVPGPPGPPGDDGSGVPTGGTANQLLSKVDGTDYNVQWVDPASFVIAVGSLLFPIGSLYSATVATNPAALLGFGTWTAYADGKVIVGKAATGTFNTGGATGGVETVTIASGNLPVHTHDIDHKHAAFTSDAGTAHTHIQDAHNHTFGYIGAYTGANEFLLYGPHSNAAGTKNSSSTTATNQNESAHTHQIDVPALGTTASGNGGFANTALTNLQPYVVAYIWQRTA